MFAGTPDFALESLRAMAAAGLTPQAVLTQPDRPSGRGKKLHASPVKSFALKMGIPVWQPQTLRNEEVAAQIAAFKPDLMVVAAYGLLVPPAVLAMPRFGCVNVHASLLPRWRGAAPIQAAILHGDLQTGISLMQMDAGLDTGPVLASAALDIDPAETAGSLHDRLADLGGALLVANLGAILNGEAQSVAQDDARATHARKIRKQDAALEWTLPAEQLYRVIRAYNPVPGASFELDGEILRCWKAELLPDLGGPAGTVLSADKHGVVVACGKGALRLVEVQRPGRRRITGTELAGQRKLEGRRLGKQQ